MIETWNLTYKKTKKKAKKIYSDIGTIECPFFNNEEVRFTSKGFGHIMRKGLFVRSRKEQRKRFALLQYIEQIVKEPQEIIDPREEEISCGGKKCIAMSWTFVKTIQSCKIKVIIGCFNNGNKRFLSVFGNNVKYIEPKNSFRLGVF